MSETDADLLLLVQREVVEEESTCAMLRVRMTRKPNKDRQRLAVERQLRRREIHLTALRLYLERLTGG